MQVQYDYCFQHTLDLLKNTSANSDTVIQEIKKVFDEWSEKTHVYGSGERIDTVRKTWQEATRAFEQSFPTSFSVDPATANEQETNTIQSYADFLNPVISYFPPGFVEDLTNIIISRPENATKALSFAAVALSLITIIEPFCSGLVIMGHCSGFDERLLKIRRFISQPDCVGPEFASLNDALDEAMLKRGFGAIVELIRGHNALIRQQSVHSATTQFGKSSFYQREDANSIDVNARSFVRNGWNCCP